MAAKKGAQVMSVDDRRWRAQADADTLARAEEIKADRTRHSAARQHASKEAQRYSRVANTPARSSAKVRK